jgi:hypothetical protein
MVWQQQLSAESSYDVSNTAAHLSDFRGIRPLPKQVTPRHYEHFD